MDQTPDWPHNNHKTAADQFKDFEHHWRATGSDKKRQAALVQLIVARVWVRKDHVVAVSLRPNYHVAVGLGTEKPTELQVDFEDRNIVLNGADGGRALVSTQWLWFYRYANGGKVVLLSFIS